MNEKLHKSAYGGFSMVSVAPSRPNHIDPLLLAKLKASQTTESAQTQGLFLEGLTKSGRPLHSKQTLTPYLSKYFELSKAQLFQLSAEPDLRPSLLKFSAAKDLKIKSDDSLTYRMYQSDIKLVRSILENSGFTQTEGHDWNLLWIGHNPKPNFYEKIGLYQKISHFPNSFEITRKDRLCSAMLRMQEQYGKEAFSFTPETYNLPDDFSLLYSNFNKEKKSLWIVKPTCSSQGKGIYLIDSVSEVPIDEVCIVSRYISNPLLINSLKFDLRIYALVTSYDPLRIYVYEEGLARFASETYRAGQKQNRFMHLTNYSLNKKSENFVQNEDFRLDDTGHKWSISAVIRLLESHGINTETLWKNIYEIIIKTIISCEYTVNETCRKLGLGRSNCFDLLGFDVLIDSNLKPWLLEVNLSPSMVADSPLDTYIKSNLLVDMFNLIGLRDFDKKKESCRSRPYSKSSCKRVGPSRSQSPPTLKKDLNGNRFKDLLKETLEEQERRGHFVRIYPSKGSNYFDQYFTTTRVMNQQIYKALYIEMMQEADTGFKIRPVTCSAIPELTQVASPQKPVLKPLGETPPRTAEALTEDLKPHCRLCRDMPCPHCRLLKSAKDEKTIVTGDDILMEYLTRLIQVLKNSKESLLKLTWRAKLHNFITHPAWLNSDIEAMIWKRLANRLQEMKDRRRKLVSSLKRKKMISEEAEKEEIIGGILRRFSSLEIEDMLKVANRNVALEVVRCLVEDKVGVLTEMLTMGVREGIDSPSFEETECDRLTGNAQIHRENLRERFFSNKQPIRKRMLG